MSSSEGVPDVVAVDTSWMPAVEAVIWDSQVLAILAAREITPLTHNITGPSGIKIDFEENEFVGPIQLKDSKEVELPKSQIKVIEWRVFINVTIKERRIYIKREGSYDQSSKLVASIKKATLDRICHQI